MANLSVGLLISLLSHAFLVGVVSGNTNYEKQAKSITYKNDTTLPTFGTLNGTVTELDTISPFISLNKTSAALNCSAGYMSIALDFKQAFYGIVYADFDRNSACKITGNGQTTSVIQLPLKGCGTFQSPARVFTNNIVVRFHPGLEIDGDEVITVVCRYPPPQVVIPPVPIPLVEAPPAVRTLQPLREFEILLIICAIIFLALMLLGIGCSYYCLKKRNIKVVRRRPLSTLGSDVTKISEPPTMFVGLKIPRAQAQDASGSEDVTESIRTDFPSDIASLQSEEEYTSAYSDKMCIITEGAIVSTLRAPPAPGFDIDMIVKDGDRVFTPVPSVATSDSETVLNAQEQYLTTILERTETNTLETLERMRKAKAQAGPPPVHARLNIKNKQVSDTSDMESESEYSKAGTEYSEQELELESRQMRNFALREGEFTQQLDESTGQYYDTHHHQQNRSDSEYGEQINRAFDSRTEVSIHDGETRYQSNLIQPIIRDRGQFQSEQSNFDVLIRIIDNNNLVRGESVNRDIDDDTSSVFTVEERNVIRRVLEEDVSLQTELKRTFTREDFHVLQRNQLIQEVVEPKKWDVLIRILNDEQGYLQGRGDDESSRNSESHISASVVGYDHHQDGYSQQVGGYTQQVAGYTTIQQSGGYGTSHLHQPGDVILGAHSGAITGYPHERNTVVSSSSGNLVGGQRGGYEVRSMASAADRSGTEITEYHHYSSNQVYEWDEDDEEEKKKNSTKR